MMDRVSEYLRANLSDPGTMRSLAWAMAGLAMNARSEASLEYWASLAMFLLGLISAAIPPKKPAP